MKKIIFFAFMVIFSSCLKKGTTINNSYARNHNVCKKLKGKILVYCIFVDTKYTKRWTEYDFQTTKDSLVIAINWIEKEAKKNGISLEIELQNFQSEKGIALQKDLTKKSLFHTLVNPNIFTGIKRINSWADQLAKMAGESLKINPKQGFPNKWKVNNKERLIAKLRDDYQVDAVCVIYMLNNYYMSDVSLTMNTINNEDVEYSIVSYKYPSVMAHEILHLFGASDLYRTQFKKSRKNEKKAEKLFENEIMMNVYGKDVRGLHIGPYTSYLIGWRDFLEDKYKCLLKEKVVKKKK